MDKDKDELHAPDGWSLKWDLTGAHRFVSLYNPEHILQKVTSGEIDPRYLDRRIALFIRVHFYVQPTLTGME